MAPVGLRPPQHKLAVAKMLAVDMHIDDDPRTAFYMARNGLRYVFLLDHAGALGGAELPANVHIIPALSNLPGQIRAVTERESSAQKD